MKGFLISPILLVSLILITGVIIINFSDIDRRIAEGIAQESRVNKVLAQAFENKTSTENLILFNSTNAAKICNGSDKNCLENEIEKELKAIPQDLSVSSCVANSFTVDYAYDFKSSIFDVSIDKRISISRIISCEQYNEIENTGARIDCGGGVFFDCPD